MTNPTPDGIREESMAFHRWSLLSGPEEHFLSQKAKLHWLKIGDGNNKQFHQAAKIREVRNSIRVLEKDGGTIAET